MNEIKNIVFDLGGVIMNLNVPQTIIEFSRLGITNIVNNTGHHYTDAIFYDFEIGKVSENEFVEKLSCMTNSKPSHLQVIEAWNAMILDMPREKINILLDLKKNYKIYLLSNTNSTHQQKFISEVNEANNFSFNDLFEKTYYSHEIGMRKPNEDVFKFLLKDSNLKPEETLFIDDSSENINAAEKLGIQTYHIQEGNSLERLFKV